MSQVLSNLGKANLKKKSKLGESYVAKGKLGEGYVEKKTM